MSIALVSLLLVGLCTALSWAPLSVAPSTVPAVSAQTEAPQAQPGGEEAEEDEVPKVDVHMVPGKRWKTSRRALLRMKSRFKQFIHDEIRKVAREYETRLDNALPAQGQKSVGESAIDIYERILQGSPTPIHPALQNKSLARFQQISEHEQLSDEPLSRVHTVTRAAALALPAPADDSTEAAAALQALFNANKMGTLLDTQQDVGPTEYLTALAEALRQSTDSASTVPSDRQDDSASVKGQNCSKYARDAKSDILRKQISRGLTSCVSNCEECHA